MYTSLLYHAVGLQGVKYISLEYEKGSTVLGGVVTSTIENCPACGSWQTLRKKGFKESMLRLVPVGMRPTFLRLQV